MFVFSWSSAFDNYLYCVIKGQMHFVDTSVMDNNYVRKLNILFWLENKLRTGIHVSVKYSRLSL